MPALICPAHPLPPASFPIFAGVVGEYAVAGILLYGIIPHFLGDCRPVPSKPFPDLCEGQVFLQSVLYLQPVLIVQKFRHLFSPFSAGCSSCTQKQEEHLCSSCSCIVTFSLIFYSVCICLSLLDGNLVLQFRWLIKGLIANRLSRFVIEFHILKAIFKFCRLIAQVNLHHFSHLPSLLHRSQTDITALLHKNMR